MGCIFFLDQGDSHVQSAAPKIKNEINMARLDMRAIAQRGSGRLVNQPESPQTGGFQHARQPIDIMLIRFDGHGQRHFLVAHLQFLDRKQKDRRKKISARIEMGDDLAVQPPFDRAAVGNVPLDQAERALGTGKILLPDLVADPAPAIRRIMNDGRNDGNGVLQGVGAWRCRKGRGVKNAAEVGNVQRSALAARFVPNRDDGVGGSKIDAEASGHSC